MNVAPEPEDRSLLGRMQAGLVKVASDLPTLLRYQAFGGTYIQREMALCDEQGTDRTIAS